MELRPLYMTSREEAEMNLGTITDEQWQWLKEFLNRQTFNNIKTKCPLGSPHYIEKVE